MLLKNDYSCKCKWKDWVSWLPLVQNIHICVRLTGVQKTSAFKPRGRFKATVLSQVLGIFRFKFLFPDHKLGPNWAKKTKFNVQILRGTSKTQTTNFRFLAVDQVSFVWQISSWEKTAQSRRNDGKAIFVDHKWSHVLVIFEGILYCASHIKKICQMVMLRRTFSWGHETFKLSTHSVILYGG